MESPLGWKMECFVGWADSPDKAARQAVNSSGLWIKERPLVEHRTHVDAYAYNGGGEDRWFVHSITIEYVEMEPVA